MFMHVEYVVGDVDVLKEVELSIFEKLHKKFQKAGFSDECIWDTVKFMNLSLYCSKESIRNQIITAKCNAINPEWLANCDFNCHFMLTLDGFGFYAFIDKRKCHKQPVKHRHVYNAMCLISYGSVTIHFCLPCPPHPKNNRITLRENIELVFNSKLNLRGKETIHGLQQMVLAFLV